jgi:predicted DNA-binding protein with PD1-like motif
MDYQKMGEKYAVRLDPEDEIVASVRAVCLKEHITAAEVRGLGAVKEFEIGLYNLDQKKFIPASFHEPGEIVSLWGDIGEMNHEIYHHIHMSCGLGDCRVVGGHLIKAVISATAELIIDPLDGTLDHRVNPTTGLNEWDIGK